MEKITRAELGEAVGNRLGVTTKDGKKVTNIFFELMSEFLSEGKSIELRNFGSFLIKDKREMMGRNPKTDEKVFVPAKKRIRFRAGRNLKKRINQ